MNFFVKKSFLDEICENFMDFVMRKKYSFMRVFCLSLENEYVIMGMSSFTVFKGVCDCVTKYEC